MPELNAMQAVYCYNFPEIRDLLHEVEQKLPDDIYGVTTPAKKMQASLEQLFNPALEVPAAKDGSISLDEIHVPIIERVVKAYECLVPALKEFKWSYPTQGSSEGLFHILAKLRTDGVNEINVLNGEYEGYEAQATNLGMKTNKYDINSIDLQKIKPGVWFISNPSARDGNIISNKFVNDLCDAGHKVVLDLAYVGATKPYEFDVSHPNIVAVVMSFSKPYGVFRHRIGGFAFSKKEIPSLYGNKWFKDTLRLCQALKIAEDIGPTKLYEKYRSIQLEIIDEINREFSLNMKPSDSFLLGYITKKDAERLSPEQLKLIEPFKRGDNYRFCLTPYFEMREKSRR